MSAPGRYYAAPRPVSGTRTGRTSVLRRVLLASMIAGMAFALFRTSPVPWMTRAMVTALWVLCVIPLYRYLGQNPAFRRPIPFFPVLSLAFGLYYALPLTLGVVDNYNNAPVYPETDYDLPVQLALLGWITMVGGYIVTGLLYPPRRPPRRVGWNPKLLSQVGFALMFGGLAVSALRSIFLSATIFGGMLQFILSLEWLGTGLLIVLARRGELTRFQKKALLVGFAVSTAMLLSQGNIAPMAMYFATGAFALWIARPYFRPRWIIGAVIAATLVVSFRGIIIDYRQEAWTRVQLSSTESLRLIVRLLGDRIEREGVARTIGHGVAMTAGRSAIMDLFANVARRTPYEVPYWKGETYKSLVGSFVPRVIWPDKPTKDLGQGFGHRYALIHQSNKSTAINLPILVEFFLNFGGTGVIIGMLVVGVIYRVLDNVVNRPGQSLLLSMIGLVILLPLLLIESDFSLVLGGLPLTGAAFYVVWWQLGRALGGTTTATAAVMRGAARLRMAQLQRPQLPAGNG